ncbi:hypothetical protein Lepil_2836 [Leptonema illini DSM 21528]|jgi:hypothetical protein|uniref:Uncharacterized protein n=1 Tax=Leptonema illini DSM 21528 TaxID=929563 RepID=H2CD30_9LEPT|nr:hypothetical protein Lepil_2836 [Leptonema illini DSM 21528]
MKGSTSAFTIESAKSLALSLRSALLVLSLLLILPLLLGL